MPSQQPTYEELKKQNEKLSKIVNEQETFHKVLLAQFSLANALNYSDDLEEGLRLCLDAAIEASELDCGGIYLFDEVTGDLNMLVHKGLSREFVDLTSIYSRDSENAKLILKGEPFYSNYQEWEEPLDQIAKDGNIHAFAVLPIRHKNNVIGCMNVGSHTLESIPDVPRISLEMITMQLGAAISKLKSDRALRESEGRYRIAIEQSMDGVVLSEGGRYFFVNSAYLKMFGYERPDEIVGKEITVTVHPEDQERVWRIYNLRLQGKKVPEMYEFKGLRKDGTLNYIEITATIINYKGRSLILAFFRDITEKKKAVEDLKKSEQKFKTFFESLPVGAVISSKYLEPMMVNQSFADMLGYSKDELQSISTLDAGAMILCPEDFQKELQYIGKMLSREIPNCRTEQRFIKKDGDILYGDVSASVVFHDDGNEVLGISSILDITEQKKAEQALREAQERYAALFDRSFDCIYLHDFEGNYLDGNNAILELTGYSKEEVTALNFSNLISPDQLAQAAESADTIIRQGYEEQLRNYKIRTRNNEIRDIETRGALIYRNGEPYAIQGVARDVTDQKKMEQTLKESESKFRSLFDDSPLPFALTTLKNGIMMDVNNEYCESSGYAKEELIGRSTTEVGFYTEEDRIRVLNELRESGKIDGLELDFRVKHGKILNCIISATIIILNDESFILSMYVDVTDMKRIESQLRQSQKMESIGTLTGGIAHEFNNILGIILGNAEMAKLRMKEKDYVENNVDQIIDASLRGKQIIRQLLDFSRQSPQTKYTLTLSPLIKESLKLLRSLIHADIDIRQSYKNDGFKALVDPTQIHQIIINLCTNASHAMSERGGIIDVAHDTVVINEKNRHRFEDLEPGRYIRLRISDTGDGIVPENLHRIFEPYFTTREFSAGTGLGLSVVHGIVKDCKGAIMVSSELREGTTFTILLPVTDADIQEDILSESSALPVGNERVLIVDDERHLGIIVKDMLEKLGYQARYVESSTEALIVFASDPDQFDLVVMDMAMPGMTGPELAGEIFKIKPDMHLILCTGYSENIDEEKAKNMGFKAFFIKPIKMEVMAKVVRKVLDGHYLVC